MAILKRDSLDILKYRGWFGSCEGCEELEIANFVDSIQTITQFVTTESNVEGRTATAGTRTVNTSLPSWSWDFTKFECGYIYQINMKRGVGSIELTDFIVTEYKDGGHGLVTNICGVEPTPTPSNDPVQLEFRCELIDGKQVLQVKNNLNPTHSNFLNRDTLTNFSSVYHFNPVHPTITDEQHKLNDPFWPAVSVSSKYTNIFSETLCCEPTLNTYTIEEGGITNVDVGGTLNSFIYTGEVCISESIGTIPATILLRVENYNYPIGKINIYGELKSNDIYFKVTENSKNQYFPGDLLGKCFKGTVDNGECNLVETNKIVDYSSFMFEHRFIEIKKYAESYSRVFVDGNPVYIFSGDNDSSEISANGDSNQYPVVVCGEMTPTPTPTPTQNINTYDLPEFRWKLINNKEVLQIKNILKPSHSNFISRNTKEDWSTVYAFDGDPSAYNLSDSFWPDVGCEYKKEESYTFDGVVISYGDLETDIISGNSYSQIKVTLTDTTEFSNNVDLSQPTSLFIYFGDNADSENTAVGQTSNWPVIQKKIMETPTPTPTPEEIDCCENLTQIEAGSAGVASITFPAMLGHTLCCSPKLQYTNLFPQAYEFAVKLNNGPVVGTIQIVAREGGITSTNFESTIFKIKNPSGDCFVADLGGMTGGEINFESE